MIFGLVETDGRVVKVFDITIEEYTAKLTVYKQLVGRSQKWGGRTPCPAPLCMVAITVREQSSIKKVRKQTENKLRLHFKRDHS